MTDKKEVKVDKVEPKVESTKVEETQKVETPKEEKKPVKKDSDTVSNEEHELNHISKKLGVEKSTIMFVKEHLKTNDRKLIEEFIERHYETFKNPDIK